MKKIGIITPNGYYNYGNRLQNYALQEVLKTFDYDVETLIVHFEKPDSQPVVQISELGFLKRILQRPLKDNLRIVLNRINRKRNALRSRAVLEAKLVRENFFLDFSEKYINEKDYSITGTKFPTDVEKSFSCFVVGSDQVWNPFYEWGMAPVYWLDFTSKSKRLSYAASIGVSKIPEEYHKIYRRYLIGLDKVSVREQEAAVIAEKLSGRQDIIVHVDPVMLLTKQQWLKISKCHANKPSGKYILTYFLGKISEDVENELNCYAKKIKCDVVHLAQEHELKWFSADPSEFLDYINGAEIFYTDSFHGCAFAIIFKTCFIVCDRVHKTSDMLMSGRIDTLLAMFDLESRKFGHLKFKGDVLAIDFTRAEVVLKNEMKRSFSYLMEVLK